MRTLDCLPQDNGLAPAKPIKHIAHEAERSLCSWVRNGKTITSWSAAVRQSKPSHQTF